MAEIKRLTSTKEMIMQTRHTLQAVLLLFAFSAIPLAIPGSAVAADAPQAQAPQTQAPQTQAREGWYHTLVDIEFVKKYAVLPKPDGVMIIDSRPAARKYDPGHIPTAVNIPDTKFDELAAGMLPQDKATLLIFYCEGPDCILSHKGAFKAEKMGYTNIRVYAEGYPEWVKKGNIAAVSPAFIKKQIDEKATMVLVDSRPKARQYDKGHIPGAISIPDSEFDKLTAKLPADKATPLYFYCGGLQCKLSANSAEKAVKLGYTSVWMIPEGYPGWEKAYGPGPSGENDAAANRQPAVEQGKESGTITVASFEKIMKEAPDSLFLVDVRDASEFAAGSFKGAVNIPIDKLEKNIATLPTDKTIVFFCGTGARAGEAYDMVKLIKPALQTYFLNADIKYAKDGSYTIAEKK
jgi:rhodanese-related sulfurtransferase